MLSKILIQKPRKLATVVVMLSAISLIGCATSKRQDPFENLTNAEIDQLEKEVHKLPKNSVILKVLGDLLSV